MQELKKKIKKLFNVCLMFHRAPLHTQVHMSDFNEIFMKYCSTLPCSSCLNAFENWNEWNKIFEFLIRKNLHNSNFILFYSSISVHSEIRIKNRVLVPVSFILSLLCEELERNLHSHKKKCFAPFSQSFACSGQ
jgi:hypothetical protein